MKGDDFKPLREALIRGEPQAIHETRKLSRQVGAELALDDSSRKARRAWRDLRRAVAPLRDHDVTGEHIGSALKRLSVPTPEVQAFQNAWAKRRDALQQELKLPDLPRVPERPRNFKKRARTSLLGQAVRLQQDASVLQTTDSVAWHEWRKDLKQYRYTLEVLTPAPRILKDTLDALGRLQDAEVVLDAVAAPEWAFGYQPELTKQERAARTRARTQVRKLWPELNAHFQDVLEKKGKLSKKES